MVLYWQLSFLCLFRVLTISELIVSFLDASCILPLWFEFLSPALNIFTGLTLLRAASVFPIC